MHGIYFKKGAPFGTNGHDDAAYEELATFLKLAKEGGYVFSTLDKYFDDEDQS